MNQTCDRCGPAIGAAYRVDQGGRWHATRTLGRSGSAGGTALRVEVVPPLSRATTGIEVITTARSAEARARLPLRWE